MEVGAYVGVGYVMVKNHPHRTKCNRSENNLTLLQKFRPVFCVSILKSIETQRNVHANVSWVDAKYYVSNIQVMSFGFYNLFLFA